MRKRLVALCVLSVAVVVSGCGAEVHHNYHGRFVSWAQAREVHVGTTWSQVLARLGKTPNEAYQKGCLPERCVAFDVDYWPIRGTGQGGINTGNAWTAGGSLAGNEHHFPSSTGYKWWRVCVRLNDQADDTTVTKAGLAGDPRNDCLPAGYKPTP